MKNKVLIALGVGLAAILIFQGNIVSTTGIGSTYSVGNTTYSQGQTDTVKWAREQGVVGAAFAVVSSDSINIARIIVKRVVGNKVVGNAVVSADTIAGAAVSGTVPVSVDSSAGAGSFVHTFTLTPYADEYWFIVKYATGVTITNGSGAKAGTYTAKYHIEKQYSK